MNESPVVQPLFDDDWIIKHITKHPKSFGAAAAMRNEYEAKCERLKRRGDDLDDDAKRLFDEAKSWHDKCVTIETARQQDANRIKELEQQLAEAQRWETVALPDSEKYRNIVTANLANIVLAYQMAGIRDTLRLCRVATKEE